MPAFVSTARLLPILAAILCSTPLPAAADPVADFYRSNTIRHYVSTKPGGGYDLRSRVFMKYFPKYIPGSPGVVIMHMPGAAGVTMANWATKVAPQDGTMIGMPNMTLPMNQVIAPTQVRYDANKLQWIGNLEEATLSIFTWHTSQTKTMRQAMERETVMGVSTRTSVLYEVLALSNKLLKTRFKIILGYEGTRVVSIERGEIEGSASTVENYSGIAPHWLPNKLIQVIAVNAEKRLPEFPDAPTMAELTDDPTSKKMLEFMRLQSSTARAIFAPPGVPAERVYALRRAFDQAARDPGFIEEMKRMKIDVNPSTGEETQARVARLLTTSPEVANMVLDAVK